MTVPVASQSDLSKLSWKGEGGYQVAQDGSRYYLREGAGSMIAGIVFGVVIGGFAGVYGVWLLVTENDLSSKLFAVLMLLVAAVFAAILIHSARRGRWMLVYDRGEPGRPGEIIVQGKRLPAERVRAFSTKSSGGGTMPTRTVVAELHDGSVEILGPSGVSTWSDHWGQHAATWMGIPFRRGR
jgi:hypothetical protein